LKGRKLLTGEKYKNTRKDFWERRKGEDKVIFTLEQTMRSGGVVVFCL
jgi:hypothetical protein